MIMISFLILIFLRLDDNWELRERLLDLVYFPAKCTGDLVKELVEKRFDLNLGKNFEAILCAAHWFKCHERSNRDVVSHKSNPKTKSVPR